MPVQSTPARPSTLSGIKRLAKAIGRTQSISHTDALKLAAIECGFQSFHHARRALEKLGATYSIFLSAYWRDTTMHPKEAGLETLQIELPRPLMSIVAKHQVGWARNLDGFFMECDDHLEMRGDVGSQLRARELLNRAALTLMFLEATGLRPATNRSQRALMQVVSDLPHHDHMSRWLAPSGSWTVLDEPYGPAIDETAADRRESWAANRGLHIARPDWPGLYLPGESVPHLISTDKSLLDELVMKVQSLPRDVVPSATEWQGSSKSYHGQFVSPSRIADGSKRKARPGTTYVWRKNATAYKQRVGYQPQWRPNKPMSLEHHVLVGSSLQRLEASAIAYKARASLSTIRSELEDWMFAENVQHARAPTREQQDAYYSGSAPGISEPNEQLETIDRAVSLLSNAYPDSVPLRNVLSRLSSARQALEGVRKAD